MKRFFLSALFILACLTFYAQMPDTTGGTEGWRYATQEDVDFWDNVAFGDAIIFKGAVSAQNIDSRQYNNPIEIEGGHKIHIWRGRYKRILFQGDNGIVEINTSKAAPVIVTNLGGQVVWGDTSNADVSRGFDNWGIKHLFISGAYDPVLGTGHPDFLGLNGDLTQKGWVYNFGMMADQHFAGLKHNKQIGNGVIITGFLSAKIRGVAAIHGYFSGFNIKNNTGDLNETCIDIQNCLSGWHEGEGFYIGYNGSQDGSTVSENQTTLKNNVAFFCGAEGIQTDFMKDGSVVANNFVYKTGCFYQSPFQGLHYQENGFQWSFTTGEVLVRDNIIYAGCAGSLATGPRYKDPGPDRRNETGSIYFLNNLLGQARMGVGYIFAGDAGGNFEYFLEHNVIDSVTRFETNDAYISNPTAGFWNIGNTTNPIHMKNNIYPATRSLYQVGSGDGSNVVSSAGSYAGKAPYLLLDENFGFDPRQVLRFKGVWKDGMYNGNVDSEGAIPYDVGDMVYTYSTGDVRYYRCIQNHQEEQQPGLSPAYWELVTWDGDREPAYTPLLLPESAYNYRGMGLSVNPSFNEQQDTIPPVLSVHSLPDLVVGSTYSEPEIIASDNKDPNVSYTLSYPKGNPQTTNFDLLTGKQVIEVHVNASDRAGNRAEPLVLYLSVKDCEVSENTRSQLNFHHFGRANILDPGNYWTDITEENRGMLDDTITFSHLRDINGDLLPWTVSIDDRGYSTHYRVHKEGTPQAVADFSSTLTAHGLALREGLETKCHIQFENLNPDKIYDFEFTGFLSGVGEIVIALSDSLSKQTVWFNAVSNQEKYILKDIMPDEAGNITLIYEYIRSFNRTWRGVSSLAGLRIIEKEGMGVVGEHCDPTAIKAHHSPAGNVFPNPVNEHLTIKLNAARPTEMLLVNSYGSVVKVISVENGQEEIDVSALKSGYYFLKDLNSDWSGSFLKK